MKSKIYKTAILMCCAVWAMTAQAQTINLQLQNSYTLTGGTTGTPKFDVGDLNNDGRPDIVTASNATNVPVNVSLNNGAGGFSAPISFGATLNASAVAIGDFNNDGRADLAVGQPNNTTGVINIRLGDGTGNFPNGTDTVLTQTVTDLAAADVNGDGNLDLLMTNANGYSAAPTNAVRVMLGNGAGGFGAPTNYGPVGSQPQDIVVADFNADGRPDVAAVAFTTTNTVSVLLNNNGSGFTAAPAISWANSTSAGRIVAGDFNRDCMTDLAVSRTGSVVILIGNNTGNFTLTPITTTNNPATLAVGDFNLDRKPDLAMGSANTTGFSILPGDGAGNFGTLFSLTASAIPDNVAVLDANLDGKMDIAMSTRTNGFSLYNGNSAVFLRTENDFDTDGRTDLSVFRPSLGDWFIQRSTQGFSQLHWGISADKPASADYDGDFKTDLAVWREEGYGDPNRSYFFILQSATNTFRQEQFGRFFDAPTVVGDWDGDGKADVAVYRSGTGLSGPSFFFYRPSATPGVDFRTVYWGTSGDQAVRGDFDGDGKFDAAVFRPSNGIWYILQSSNNQPLYRSWGISGDRPVPADYDADGKTDVAVFRPNNRVWYILNSGNGTVSYQQLGVFGDTLVPADYNGDGRAEAAVYRPTEQRWYIPLCGVSPAVNTKFGVSGDLPVPVAP